MTTAVIILSVICSILLALVIASGYYLWRLGRTVIAYIDAVEKCLDILNVSYARVFEILQTPVGSDDPLVRSVVEEIKRSHDAILVVAQTLSHAWHEDQDEEEDTDDAI